MSVFSETLNLHDALGETSPKNILTSNLFEKIGDCEGGWTEVAKAAHLLPNTQASIGFPLALIPGAFALCKRRECSIGKACICPQQEIT